MAEHHDEADMVPLRLTDRPDWRYLLHEFELLYRHGSAGGSKAIRTHRKRVRDTLSAVIDANPEIVFSEPEQKPVTAHLGRAFDLAARNGLYGISRALERLSPQLTWQYGYKSVPKALARKYAFCDILGPGGPVKSERLTLGFVLFAPNTVYPQHSHQDIEESYISVSGAWSENEQAVYAPGSLILNRPGEEHRITTGEFDPCLLAYAWIGPGERLAEPGMKFSKVRKRVERGI
ncbi:dimethylsulfonioproprionate lyase family protein [Rhizobium sp. L1K21]|uniref:dimethylsulfonioproprionate lyase family protein n=1 Tax=Rhizobium sp. L1K21 TaxID=2954933 RepID=UPI0020923F5D|nr:dimethylsulfonioproprionate lyase family protein [Rhizobium sp. L1K21]MCO6188132.1 dimethylsulfoniopropionate lyase [Rhizobium sp. L1K21]